MLFLHIRVVFSRLLRKVREMVNTFAKQMEEISLMLEKGRDEYGRSVDQETAHWMADQLMCDTLRNLGFGEGIEIFENIPKWYA